MIGDMWDWLVAAEWWQQVSTGALAVLAGWMLLLVVEAIFDTEDR